MDYLTALQVAASGMTAQKARLDLVASNLANAQTTRAPGGGPYRRLDPVFRALPVSAPFESQLAQAIGPAPRGVTVEQVVQDPSPPRQVYDPGHPDADARGFVAFPNVNVVEEMVNLVTAQRSYEANATALETLKAMAARALDIAR